MIQDQYLPQADVSKAYHITIESDPSKIYPKLEYLDFSQSKLIYWLFKLRGIPVPSGMSMIGLRNMGFVLLEQRPPQALILGLIGKFWTMHGSLQKFEPNEFTAKNWEDQALATWSFELEALSKSQTKLITETRVLCPNGRSRRKFRLYWLLIEPFSGWIRKEILKSIKRQVEP
ncbi:MAG: hypothetical protein ACR2MX_11040 [Cyclobacteriaceae bacterium]